MNMPRNETDEQRRIRQNSEAYKQTRRDTYARNKVLARVGRPRKWDSPRTGILLSKKKYRDKKRQEKVVAAAVISYRCACGLEGKAEVFTPDKTMCIWCEYDNSTHSNTGN